jgi:hypothetical protein
MVLDGEKREEAGRLVQTLLTLHFALPQATDDEKRRKLYDEMTSPLARLAELLPITGPCD